MCTGKKPPPQRSWTVKTPKTKTVRETGLWGRGAWKRGHRPPGRRFAAVAWHHASWPFRFAEHEATCRWVRGARAALRGAFWGAVAAAVTVPAVLATSVPWVGPW